MEKLKDICIIFFSVVRFFRILQYSVLFSGIDHEVDTNFKVLGMSIKLILNIKASLDLFEAKVEAKICSDMLQICFPTIEVFTDIKFSKTKPQRTFFFCL